MPTVKETFDAMGGLFKPERAAGTNAVIKDGTCAVAEGPGTNPALTLQMAAQDWLDMTSGKQSGQMLFMSGKLKLKGDMGLAMKLGSMFSM